MILILLLCFTLTIKLSTFPLLLAVFYLLLKKHLYKNKRALAVIIASAVIIILPWLIRTYVLTGYILYPVKLSGFLKPDWQVPIEVLKFDKLLINNGPKMISENWEEVDKLSFMQWFPLWIKAQLVRGLLASLSLLAIAIISSAIMLVVSIRQRSRHIVWLSIINITCILFWLFNSPDYRFGYPYLINSILLLLLFITFNKPLSNYIKAIACICVPAICAYYIYPAVDYLHKQSIASIAVKPLEAEIYKTKIHTKNFPFILLNERVKLYIEDANHNCNLVDLPCFPVYFQKLLPQQIELRGKSIEDGFRIKQQ